MSMIKQTLAGAMLAVISLSAFADDKLFQQPRVSKQVELKDGGTLYTFQDGKMAVADKWGRAARNVTAGAAVEAKDGQRVVLTSNEVNRIDAMQPDPQY